MVVDADTGEVLHAVNADHRNYPASLTKMMTLYLLFDAMDRGQVRLGDRIPVSAHASAQAPSKLGLRPGQTIVVEDAILGICTKSANDAAAAVAEFLGGSEPAFAEMMTRKAKELGMRETQFRNASGLPSPPNLSSARDMATLARALLHNHARFYHYFSTQQFTYNGETMRNHNHLMEWYEGADGIKTGYIGAAGFNLVASVKRDGRRLVGVVFGGESAAARDRHMAQLLDAAFARTPGSSGVELANLPEQNDEEEAPAPSVKSKAKVHMAQANTRAVLKAMAAARTGKAIAKKVVAARAKAAKEDDSSGDADEDNWGIQVGAYAQQVKAKEAAATAKHKLGKLVADGDVSIAHEKGHHPTYRARVIGLPEQTAREACRRLTKSKVSCAVINAG
ncbi:D-alanyl-D-alanine carboxypeptidase family protein [Telmatospirillum sp.]|uniref:D-alanyl-D-alanine carboxypeptidase family protein n=1 Tax=Telmatospirillum sp. TaxID=2079197 RepID=UPI00284E26E7|nr:D-alanyl-D-alanine carboxypeptidase family protein [Telmatospirillum sp.]MDR3436925.1 D-alanyl-D-alanine carboxypeptidase [Telmatospirillum sp.]